MDPTFIGQILGAVLTLMVFSYLFGNNPLYRVAQHLFVGVSIGYATLLLLGGVVIPQGSAALGNIGNLAGWLQAVPFVLGLYLLVARSIRPAARGGSLALNIAISTAAALAIGGALAGTLVPQVADTMRPLSQGGIFGILNNLIVILGVALVLFYFSFSLPAAGQRSQVGTVVASAGRWTIVVTLGALLGTLTVTFVASLVERVDFFFNLF